MLTADRVLPIVLAANWIYALPSSDGLLLVDAGPDYESAWEVLTAQLDAAGYRPEDVRAVVVTHAHLDHCGLARRWQEMRATIYGAPAEAARFALGQELSRYQADETVQFLDACGVPAERLQRFATAWRAMSEPDSRSEQRGRWPSTLRGTPFTPDRSLTNDAVVRVGDRAVQWVATPGHTPGNGVCFEPVSGALFSGDQLLPGITPNPGIQFDSATGERLRSLPAYTRSLQRIAGLTAHHLYPGHGEHTPRVAEEIARVQRHHRRRQDRILRFLHEGPLTPYAVMMKFFPHLPDARLRQAMAEVVGQIDALVEAGRVAEDWASDGVWHVRAV